MNGRELHILIVGPNLSGKTSLARSLHGLPFDPGAPATLGVQCLESRHNARALQLKITTWEVGAAQIELIPALSVHFCCVLLCFSSESPDDISEISQFYACLRLLFEQTPFFLVACRFDELVHMPVSGVKSLICKAQRLSRRLGLPLFFTSSLVTFSIKTLFMSVMKQLELSIGQ